MATELKTPELSRHAAAAFAEKWKHFTDEKQYAESFWRDFFSKLCGIEDDQLAGIKYQKEVTSSISGNQEYIDVYWQNVALIEQKTAGLNLDKAELQARGYWLSLPPGYRPKTIIVCDFLNFRLIDVALNRTHDFPLSKLPENIHRFEAIISGNRTRISEEEITVDQVAAKLMANLYLELEDHGFEGHETSIFLIRILFLLFGDDTGMWEKNMFLKLVMGTKEDGRDLGSKLDVLFDVLNTASDKRSKELGDEFKLFPYVNGGIFAEKISIIDFNKRMRVALVDVANYDWTTINPTIFGSLFQLIKTKEERHALGEHYTSEENINKIVYPLFLDELQERLAASWDNKKELRKLRQELAKIKVFDPACGCGNFLVVAYRHLRQLELELIVRLNNLEGKQDSMQLDGSMGLSITLNQFYGIEIEEWPAQVARMALFLTDHQENLRLERITGAIPNRFPLKDTANITHYNALIVNWDKIVSFDESTYILGNPPFIGARYKSPEQSRETEQIWDGVKGSGDIDYVCNWFLLAAQIISKYGVHAAFVSTNSISQGEQPTIIWKKIAPYGVAIAFAHRTFVWQNESRNAAAVHCVIIGMVRDSNSAEKALYSYASGKGEPTQEIVKNINPYLIDGPDILIEPRKSALQSFTPRMDFGSMPNDGGHLSDISEEEFHEISASDHIAAKYLRRLIGGRELIHDEKRYCLWLIGAEPSDIRTSLVLKERVSAVKKLRSESKRAATKKLAEKPSEFGEIRQPKSKYLAVPLITSENREYLPVAIMSADVISNNKIGIIDGADLFTFALLISKPFTVWNKAISGRIKSDFNISVTTTYNNFPFPEVPDGIRTEIDGAANEILEARTIHQNATLADLYDASAMPSELRSKHKALDSIILKAYGLKPSASESEILEKLFQSYRNLAQPTLS